MRTAMERRPYRFYTAIVISHSGVRGAPALPCGRRWNAVPTGSILLFVAEYRNADQSGSCLFVSREGGHSCPARRCDPQGWRWRVRTARRSRGLVRTRQRQVAVRRLIDSPDSPVNIETHPSVNADFTSLPSTRPNGSWGASRAWFASSSTSGRQDPRLPRKPCPSRSVC